MIKGQHNYLNKMKGNKVQMTSLRSIILVKSELEYMLHFILVSSAIGSCFLDFLGPLRSHL